MPLPLLAMAGAVIGGGMGVMSAYATQQSERSKLLYSRKLKERQDENLMDDLRQGGHEALLALHELSDQTLRNKSDVQGQVADAVGNAVVAQAASGYTGNTAERISNAIYAEGGNLETDLSLEKRAEMDGIEKQLAAFSTSTRRGLEGDQIIDYTTSLGTGLQLVSAGLEGGKMGAKAGAGAAKAF